MPAVRRPVRPRRRGANAQSLVEFALLSPLVVLLIFGAIDASRAVYTYNAISDATREGARLVSLKPQNSSDCDPLSRMTAVAQGFSLSQDPHSVYDGNTPPTTNTDPNNPPAGSGPTTPTAGKGYMYIYPAVAPSTTVCDNNLNTRPCPTGVKVTVEVSYSFTPITPLVSGIFGNPIMHSTSVVNPGYC